MISLPRASICSAIARISHWGMAVGPETADMVELPGVCLEGDAAPVGIRQDVGRSIGRYEPDLPVHLLGFRHDLHKGAGHADLGYGGRYRNAKGGAVILTGHGGHTMALQLGKTTGADGKLEEQIDVLEFPKDLIIGAEVPKGTS